MKFIVPILLIIFLSGCMAPPHSPICGDGLVEGKITSVNAIGLYLNLDNLPAPYFFVNEQGLIDLLNSYQVSGERVKLLYAAGYIRSVIPARFTVYQVVDQNNYFPRGC